MPTSRHFRPLKMARPATPEAWCAGHGTQGGGQEGGLCADEAWAWDLFFGLRGIRCGGDRRPCHLNWTGPPMRMGRRFALRVWEDLGSHYPRNTTTIAGKDLQCVSLVS